MNRKTRQILKSRESKLLRRLRKHGTLDANASARLATLQRRLGADQQREIERAALENAIAKD